MTDLGQQPGMDQPLVIDGVVSAERPEAVLQVEAYTRAIEMGAPAVLGCSDIYTTDWDGYPDDPTVTK